MLDVDDPLSPTIEEKPGESQEERDYKTSNGGGMRFQVEILSKERKNTNAYLIYIHIYIYIYTYKQGKTSVITEVLTNV